MITSLLARPDHGYDHVVATKDYHIDPGSHFADEPDYRKSWPAHCVAGSTGSEFHPDLDTTLVEATFRKGAHAAAYSGFEGTDDDGTPLADWLRDHDVQQVDVVGIATDYCVRATAADAAANGFETRVLLGLTTGVAPGSTSEAIESLREAGSPRLSGVDPRLQSRAGPVALPARSDRRTTADVSGERAPTGGSSRCGP